MTISMNTAVARMLESRSSRCLMVPFSESAADTSVAGQVVMAVTGPGDLVMSRATSRMIPAKAGDMIGAAFARLGSVGINVVA